MYAGFLTPSHSTQWLGAHQKFNRLAHRMLIDQLNSKQVFPDLKLIQFFEGKNGPDGIKVKSPSQHEPWHYYNPFDPRDTQLVELLSQHFESLTEALATNNVERAAFEASWMAHGITDGLTPAHQYPYEHELQRITGQHHLSRTSRTKKIIAQGSTKRETLTRNWQLWGAKGLMATHHGFELGVATISLPMRLRQMSLLPVEIDKARELGVEDMFKESAMGIAKYHMYERFYRTGWNVPLAQDVKKVLVPTITKTVALAWLLALEKVNNR